MKITNQELHDYNRAAQECANHRMTMVSSERVLVNERYDNHSESPENVKQYIYVFGCAICNSSRTLISINK